MTKKENIVVSLFHNQEPAFEEAALDISHLSSAPSPVVVQAATAVNLAGMAKVLMAIGTGATGKTTLLRWICERALERPGGAPHILATVDPVNRELAHYFHAVESPPRPAKGVDPTTATTAWLERLFSLLMKKDGGLSAAIDFGGGDTSLMQLIGQVPELADMLRASNVEPVALYTLSPRSTDLTPLAAMDAAGFQPRATALILNESRTVTADPVAEFAQVRRHSTYKAALDRGAIEIWMPRLFAAKAVEDRRISFAHAKAGTMPEGRSGSATDFFDRIRVSSWLDAMDKAFAPIASWLL